MIQVNLKTVYLCSRAAIPVMIANGRGSIVNMASIAATRACSGASYAAAKAGMLGYTAQVAPELASRGVRVNCVSPGFMRTPMSTGERHGLDAAAQEAQLAAMGQRRPDAARRQRARHRRRRRVPGLRRRELRHRSGDRRRRWLPRRSGAAIPAVTNATARLVPKRRATDLFGPHGTPTIAIVGAGMGGIAAGVLFRKAGIETFTIYEQSERVGGTWWDNQYPGAEVDVDSYVYSFPFKRYDWTRTHARQAEIHAYLEETVTEFGLAPHLRLGTGVTRAVWDDDAHVYRLTLTTGEETECHVLISAVGFLNVPYYPDWPGLDEFEGPCFHTARWEHQHDLGGKTVAVVGTGSTASQLVPALQPVVGKLLLFQREPGWVLPKGDRDYTREERARLHNPVVHRYRRAKWYWATEKRLWNGGVYRPGTRRAHCVRAGGAALHREGLRGPPRPRGRGHADVPVLGEAHDLQLRLLSRVEATQRGVGAARGDVDHRSRHRRRRWCRARRRRPRARDRLPADELPRAPRGGRASG